MITVFWHVTPCGLVDRYQRIRGTCSLYFLVMLKIELRGSCETLVSTELHGATPQNSLCTPGLHSHIWSKGKKR
jgi:hypothetical protein